MEATSVVCFWDCHTPIGIREEGIAMSGDFDLPVQGINPQVQYLQNDCLFFQVSENEGVRKPWLVDPMPRSDLKQAHSITQRPE